MTPAQITRARIIELQKTVIDLQHKLILLTDRVGRLENEVSHQGMSNALRNQ
jgi:hypothetical protein